MLYDRDIFVDYLGELYTLLHFTLPVTMSFIFMDSDSVFLMLMGIQTCELKVHVTKLIVNFTTVFLIVLFLFSINMLLLYLSKYSYVNVYEIGLCYYSYFMESLFVVLIITTLIKYKYRFYSLIIALVSLVVKTIIDIDFTGYMFPVFVTSSGKNGIFECYKLVYLLLFVVLSMALMMKTKVRKTKGH